MGYSSKAVIFTCLYLAFCNGADLIPSGRGAEKWVRNTFAVFLLPVCGMYVMYVCTYGVIAGRFLRCVGLEVFESLLARWRCAGHDGVGLGGKGGRG
ncbi:uncharacterized protein F4807DRAFT_417132 [Annulohypoxylon truncatum]|uniref:uncharacterized protein n=1 Tax=Annulohypoxylon truncatum TaxID=327061 RepID=UPI002008C68D|nr:uncharacterized protein F4807DRAFT_417132 [Annulohypoxylon truncatum]KAI1211985.1 hypothetical protein F4807DRAFT_417132 [Annulohypoxylon truncatum]